MVKYRAYFDIPSDYNQKNIKGSSPDLLEKLINELDDAIEIKISFFLYNNPFLHNWLEKLSAEDCVVNIYSIPLNGYTDKPVKIHNPNKNKDFFSSKLEYAEKIYNRIEDGLFPNIKLKLFPHTYVWSKQLYSRGKEAYTLHNKSVLAVMKDGATKCISSSSNLAFADPPHSDNFLVVENDQFSVNMFKSYFELLEKNSLSLQDYKDFAESNYDFQFRVSPTDLNLDNYHNCFYSAPFITYNGQGSNHYVQQKIIDFMKSAQRRIFTCSQHFMDIDSFDKYSMSILEALGEIATKNPALDVRILKQTRADNQAQGKRTKLAEKYIGNIKNAEQRNLSPTIHDKFIIVDDKIIVMTANITPTQFAWSYPHTMKYDVNNKIYVVENNCFSEINSFHFIEDEGLTRLYEAHYMSLWEISNGIL